MKLIRQLTTLQIALTLSVLAHAALLTVRFVDPQRFDRVLQDTPLEVILVNARSEDRPEKAQAIAQANLAGGGNVDQGRATSPLPPSPQARIGEVLEEEERRIEAMKEQQSRLLAQLRQQLAALPTPDPSEAAVKRAGDPYTPNDCRLDGAGATAARLSIVTGPNMATVYSDRGQGVRAPVVFYNRSNEAAAQLKPGDFDWGAIFGDRTRWFHSGGIFAALSETTGELIIEGMKAAKAAGAITSIDLNYRAKLWNLWGGREIALKVLKRIVENVDVIVGNEEDLQMGLGIPGPKVAVKSKLDPSVFFGMIDKVTDLYPNVKVVATTLREVHSTNRHSWGAVAWINGQTYQSPTCELGVLDRVGGGDGYAAGFFYGLLSGASEQEAVNLGWAHGALLTTFPGDTTMATLEQVRAFAKGGSARIQR